jgi:hypothetical protein
MSTRPRTTPLPPPSEPPSRGIQVGLLPFVASIVGVLLVCGIIGGVLWVTRDGADGPVSTHTEASQPGGAITGTPELDVHLDGQTLVFTFEYEGLEEGDYFEISTGGDPDSVKGTPVRVDGRELRVGLAPGVQQCGMVRVVRGTQSSGWSQVQCETVRKS